METISHLIQSVIDGDSEKLQLSLRDLLNQGQNAKTLLDALTEDYRHDRPDS